MLHQHINGSDMAYIEVGEGSPLVCVHGSLCDFRIWSCVLGPLSRRHRVIAPSLRHFFPEHWDGADPDYTMAQHVADMIGFIEALGVAPLDLMGHSRGGHIAFRVAQQRPDVLRRVVLAEPGGDLDASLASAGATLPPMRDRTVAAAQKIAAGDVEGGLAGFFDGIDGEGAWRALPPYEKQAVRDNAYTLVGQANEQRQPFSRADAEFDPDFDAVGGWREDPRLAAGGTAGAGSAHSRGASRDHPERRAFHVRTGPAPVLPGSDGLPGGMRAKWGASVARCPPNRAYRLCSDSERLCVVIGTCHMAR